jgi:hypothetical protein
LNEQKYPQFERLHILRTEALCSIRDRAFDTFPLLFENYGEGIINGCRLITTSNLITLGEGIILHNHFLYLIKSPMNVEYSPTEEYMAMKLIFEPQLETENFVQRNISIILTPDLNLSENEMELCRFKLKKGAVLRTNYTDFFDRATEFDTVNVINVPYAAIGGSTLSPEIIYDFAAEAKNFLLDFEDYNFCFAALSKKVLTAEQIAFYIENRLKIELPAPLTNQMLFENLCLILQEIKSGRRREIIGTRRRRREIIVE